MVHLNSSHAALVEFLPRLQQTESNARLFRPSDDKFDIYVEGVWQPDLAFENFLCCVSVDGRYIKGALFKDRIGRPYITMVIKDVLYKVLLLV